MKKINITWRKTIWTKAIFEVSNREIFVPAHDMIAKIRATESSESWSSCGTRPSGGKQDPPPNLPFFFFSPCLLLLASPRISFSPFSPRIWTRTTYCVNHACKAFLFLFLRNFVLHVTHFFIFLYERTLGNRLRRLLRESEFYFIVPHLQRYLHLVYWFLLSFMARWFSRDLRYIWKMCTHIFLGIFLLAIHFHFVFI